MLAVGPLILLDVVDLHVHEEDPYDYRPQNVRHRFLRCRPELDNDHLGSNEKGTKDAHPDSVEYQNRVRGKIAESLHGVRHVAICAKLLVLAWYKLENWQHDQENEEPCESFTHREEKWVQRLVLA